MRRKLFSPFSILALAAALAPAPAHTAPATPAIPPNPPITTPLRLDSLAGLELVHVKAELASWRGRRAVRLIDHSDQRPKNSYPMAILSGSDLGDGVVEAEVAGQPRAGADPSVRGFIGIAFHVQDHGARFECFYLRPTNGRADDQLRRNHSTQYISQPGFPWEKLRRESPGVYESYVDLDAGAWTKIRIVTAGTKARLYVGDAGQPALIVNDLKQGAARGQIALWVGDDTDGYFSNLTVH